MEFDPKQKTNSFLWENCHASEKSAHNVLTTGANPTTSIYNASVVNFYNATSSVLKKYFILLWKLV
jgi:hypothetical protein